MKKAFSIGVDLGGTNLRAAAYSAEGEFLHKITLATRLADGRHNVVSDLCGAISSLLRKYPERECAGIGIGSPGPLELPSGIIRNPPNLHGWDGFNLRDAIESTIGRPINIENDANLAALAEQVAGAGRLHAAESLCMLTLGTGVGSGIILNGKVWHGNSGMGGEAGHICVEPDGHPCGCGGTGCLEQYASATAIVRMMSEKSQGLFSSLEIAQMAKAGDPAAQAVFRRVGRALAIALTSVVNTLNLPLYVIGGGASDAWDLFAPTMFEQLLSRSYIYRITAPRTDAMPNGNTASESTTQICRAVVGSDAGLLGACLLGFEKSSQLENALEMRSA